MAFQLDDLNDDKALAKVKEVYEEAFPPVERFPFEAMTAASKAGLCRMRGAFDDGRMVGICVTAASDDLVYIAYLAMDASTRSKGYGSKTLSAVFEEAGGRPTMLDVEPVGHDAPNERQRERRMAFYERNGFTRTGCFLVEDGESYEVLCHGAFSKEALEGLFKHVDEAVSKLAGDKAEEWGVDWSLSEGE